MQHTSAIDTILYSVLPIELGLPASLGDQFQITSFSGKSDTVIPSFVVFIFYFFWYIDVIIH